MHTKCIPNDIKSQNVDETGNLKRKTTKHVHSIDIYF